MTPVTRTGAPRRAPITLAIVLTTVLTLLALVLPQVSRASAATAAAPSAAQMIQRVIDDTNALRAEQGLPGLVRDSRLDQVGQAWAEQQWKNGAMSHNPNYSNQIPPGWQRAGENVAKGYTYAQVVQAWKNSSSHYANIVNDYTSVGLGYYEQDGKRYWSMVFAKYPGTAQPSAAASSPAPAPAPTATTPPAPAAPPGSPAGTAIALTSPSFENGLGAWSAPSGAVDGGAAKGGTKSLAIPGASGRTVSQSVSTTVAAGSTHTLTVWVRADASATGAVRLRALGGTEEVATVNFTASESGWLKVTVALTVKSAHTGFAVEVLTTAAGRTYRVDSVSLVRTGEPAAPAQPAPATGASGSPSTSPTPGQPASPSPTPSQPANPSPAPASPSPSPSPSQSPSGGLNLGIIRIGSAG